MAQFEVEHSEGLRRLRVDLAENEAIRTEHRALHHLRGGVKMDMPLPSPRAWLVSLFSEESLLRPRYTGPGQVYLDSTLGGYHELTVHEGEKWVLDNRCFWASEATVRLGVYREWILTSLWAGEGLLWYKTVLTGQGKVVLSVDGPVEELQLNNDRVVIDGSFVVARTNGIKFSMKRPTRSLLSYWLSGEKLARTYQGTGRLLICPTPYWRLMVSRRNSSDPAALE